MIGETVSHYTIMGVWRRRHGRRLQAEDTRPGRSVALKFLPDELSRNPLAVGRFEREARAVSALNHPRICSVHDVGEHGGRRFIVMGPWKDRRFKILAAGALPTDRVVELGPAGGCTGSGMTRG